MNADDILLVEDRGRVRTLTFNRPDQLNAFNDKLYDAIAEGLTAAAADPNVACVVMTGNGRAFCAGTDLGELGSPPVYDDGKEHGFQPFMDALQSFPKPLIAAVNGLGVGIGLTMLPHCDLVIMADNARLRAPFVSLGVTAEAGSTALLPSIIGWAATAHLLYTASWLQAQRAVEFGLAWKAVPEEQLLEETSALADKIAAMPVASLVATKGLLLHERVEAINRARARENEVFAGLVGGPANQEALAAFAEKRDPDFSKLQ